MSVIALSLMIAKAISPSPSTHQGPAIKANRRSTPETIGRFQWCDSVIPVNGTCEPFSSNFDKTMSDYLREVGAPGGALTVYFKGKPIYSKGFGYADIDTKRPFTPQTPSRISSVSKFLTQSAIEDMIEYGELEPDAKVVDILKKGGIVPLPLPAKTVDPRINQVTIQELLDHKSGIQAGLDISECTSKAVRHELKFSTPVTDREALGYVLGLPLEATPGKTFVYSNFGYALLGKVIEILSGEPYERAIKDKVLKPILDPAHWFVTSACRKDRRAEEADYYSTRSYPTWDAYRWDILEGAGGWVVPTDELAEFFAKKMPGPGWHYTLFGSYTGAVTVMELRDDSLLFVANVNYRRGNDPGDNELLRDRLASTAKTLSLP